MGEEVLRCFVAGISGVFLVMILLQVAVILISRVAIGIEAHGKKGEV